MKRNKERFHGGVDLRRRLQLVEMVELMIEYRVTRRGRLRCIYEYGRRVKRRKHQQKDGVR